MLRSRSRPTSAATASCDRSTAVPPLSALLGRNRVKLPYIGLGYLIPSPAPRACSELALSGEAMEAIGEFYCELRGSADLRALPITVRTLETILRLSTAAAKARLAKGARPVRRRWFAWCASKEACLLRRTRRPPCALTSLPSRCVCNATPVSPQLRAIVRAGMCPGEHRAGQTERGAIGRRGRGARRGGCARPDAPHECRQSGWPGRD
jgi:hypothetical protein